MPGLKYNQTKYTNDAAVARLVNQMKLALNFGRMGPLSKARNKRKPVGVKKSAGVKKPAGVRKPPGAWTFTGNNGVLTGEGFLTAVNKGVLNYEREVRRAQRKTNKPSKGVGRLKSDVFAQFEGDAPVNLSRASRNRRGRDSVVVLTWR